MKISFNLQLLFIFLYIIQSAIAQDSWDPAILEKANTAKNTHYLKESEKEVIFYTNLARADGKLFSESYLELYLKSNELKPDSFTLSLLKELEFIKDLPMLYPDNELYDIARDHAIKSGKSGKKGHQGFEKRFKEARKIFYAYGENCYYGRDNSLLIVLELLIDNGINDLGHRRNMLDPVYNFVGVSIMPHKESGYNCVMDFGAR
jgi:hypothetical protein